jgi:hypothetical protein
MMNRTLSLRQGQTCCRQEMMSPFGQVILLQRQTSLIVMHTAAKLRAVQQMPKEAAGD